MHSGPQGRQSQSLKKCQMGPSCPTGVNLRCWRSAGVNKSLFRDRCRQGQDGMLNLADGRTTTVSISNKLFPFVGKTSSDTISDSTSLTPVIPLMLISSDFPWKPKSQAISSRRRVSYCSCRVAHMCREIAQMMLL